MWSCFLFFIIQISWHIIVVNISQWNFINTYITIIPCKNQIKMKTKELRWETTYNNYPSDIYISVCTNTWNESIVMRVTTITIRSDASVYILSNTYNLEDLFIRFCYDKTCKKCLSLIHHKYQYFIFHNLSFVTCMLQHANIYIAFS